MAGQFLADTAGSSGWMIHNDVDIFFELAEMDQMTNSTKVQKERINILGWACFVL